MNDAPNPTQKPCINIVWFKRDLRLSDHEPLKRAFATYLSTLLIYNFEPILLEDNHYTARHWRFVWQSLLDMNDQLKRFNARVYVFCEPMQALLARLASQYHINGIFSHEEIGLAVTYQRDRTIAAWCRQANIPWYESPTGAVQRGLVDRKQWDQNWHQTMGSELATPDWKIFIPATLKDYHPPAMNERYQAHSDQFQIGGSREAHKTLQSFLTERARAYAASISNPSASRTHCSRLSPYLAWGNISLRQVYQATKQREKDDRLPSYGWKRPLNAFKSRLHWHCHFIQKFDSECEMEFMPLNAGYRDFPYRDDDQVTADIQRWSEGNTGIPMIDACMRCLEQTGYINFRMRAMLVSFVTHHLNIDWRLASLPLAQRFLDFEPGIHYPQIQMQASVTGINTIRIYNPIKQSKEQDEDGSFKQLWCPELRSLTKDELHEPWLVSNGSNSVEVLAYPKPMIDLAAAAKRARERLWSYRKREAVTERIPAILAKHVSPKSRR